MKIKKKKNLQIELAKENIDFFFKLLDKRFNPNFDKSYIKEIKRLSEGFNIRLDRKQKLKFCKKCYTYQNTNTREIRLNKKTKTIDYICKNCNNIRRFRYK